MEMMAMLMKDHRTPDGTCVRAPILRFHLFILSYFVLFCHILFYFHDFFLSCFVLL
jgi:hypothetical protein